MLILMGIDFVFRIIYSVLVYAACAYSLYVIAKRNSVAHPYLAFVPIVQYYVIGSICEEYELWGYRIKNLALVMCLLSLVQLLSGMVGSFAAAAFNMASTALIALILHKFFYLFTPQNAFIFALLSLFGRFPLAIILFFIKDKPMKMSAAAYQYPFANKIR